jgi:hypothetical protein
MTEISGRDGFIAYFNKPGKISELARVLAGGPPGDVLFGLAAVGAATMGPPGNDFFGTQYTLVRGDDQRALYYRVKAVEERVRGDEQRALAVEERVRRVEAYCGLTDLSPPKPMRG